MNFKFVIPTLIISSLSLSTASQAFNVTNKLYSRLQSKPLVLNTDILSLSIGDLVTANIETGISVFPNNDLKTYSRSEPLEFSLRLGDTILSHDFSIRGQRSSSFTGEFIRQFSSQIDALNVIQSPPYIIDSNNLVTGDKIPFTPRAALNLKNNDYFRYQIRTSFNLDGRVGLELGATNLIAGRSYLFSGDFQIEVYRKEGSKVLVRASSLKQKERSNFVSLRPNFAFNVFESSLLNTLGENIIPDDLIEIEFNAVGAGSLLSIEYEFDLSKNSAKDAYNKMINPSQWEIKDLISVTRGQEESRLKVLHTRIDDAETKSLQNGTGVKRLLRSSVDFQIEEKNTDYDFIFVEGSNQKIFLQQDISLINNPFSNERDNFRVSTHSISNEIQGPLTNLLRQTDGTIGEANAVFELDQYKRISRFVELSFSYEHTNRVFNRRDYLNAAGNIYKIIPGDLHGDGVRNFIQTLNNYTNGDEKGDKIILKADVSIKPEAFSLVNRLSSQVIKETASAFIEAVRVDQRRASLRNKDYGNLNIRPALFSDKDTILNLLPVVFLTSTNNDYDAQWDNLLELQEVPLFKVLGSGIITRLLMKAVTEEYGVEGYLKFYDFAKISLKVRGKNTAGLLEYENGSDGNVQYVQKIIELRNRILNRNFDPSFFQ